MSLSVCCLAGAPGPRVRALIEPLREVADEIVIAADMRVDRAGLADYALVADRLFRIEVIHSERHFAWLHAQCSGDWIFRIDADEIPSPDLVAGLPSLTDRREIRQVWFPRKWLYGDTGHWLNEPPWWPDYQLRLYRNDPFLRFAGKQHTTAVSQPPDAYTDAPLLHLDLLVNSLEDRKRKVAFYDALRPAMKAPGGGAMNERFYLPESAPTVELAELSGEQRQLVDGVLEARPQSEGAKGPELPVIPAAEMDNWLEGRGFDPAIHRGVVEPFETNIRMSPSEQRAIYFHVTNTGVGPWHWHNPEVDGGRQVRLSYHWFNDDDSIYEYDGLRTWLPCRLGPGDSTIVPLMVQAPAQPGTYTLEVDLVHERWFGCSIRLTVPVEPRRDASAAAA